LIDLHLHTTASDGFYSPSELVQRANKAKLRTISVTDHDTMAGVSDVIAAAAAYGITVVPGVEITAVWQGLDIHLLGYFLDEAPVGFQQFLATSRQARWERIQTIVERLDRLGVHISADSILRQQSDPLGSLGRPHVARALIKAGHVKTIREAFDRWLAAGQPAFVPRHSPSPRSVIKMVAAAGGVASLAHPGLLKSPHECLLSLVADGLGAIEVFHSRHNHSTQLKFLDQARTFDLAVTGGSDFHGHKDGRSVRLGRFGLPRDHFSILQERLVLARKVATR